MFLSGFYCECLKKIQIQSLIKLFVMPWDDLNEF